MMTKIDNKTAAGAVKKLVRPILVVLTVTLISACAMAPKDIEQRKKGLESQARFYDEEAKGWREDGNEAMAVYFDIKAHDARKRRAEVDDDWFDILIDALFDLD